MKITYNELEAEKACSEGLAWFKAKFGDSVDSDILVEKLKKEKKPEWLGWLFVALKLSGVWEVCHTNGQLWFRENYKDGRPDGLWEYWYENGQLRYRRNYKDGKRYGLWEEWYENGQLSYRGNYKDGKEIKNENI